MRSIEVRVALVLALYSMDKKLLGLGPVRPVSLLFSFSFASQYFRTKTHGLGEPNYLLKIQYVT